MRRRNALAMNRYLYYWLCVFVAPFGFKWMIKKCPYGYVDACPNWHCPGHYRGRKYYRECLGQNRDNYTK